MVDESPFDIKCKAEYNSKIVLTILKTLECFKQVLIKLLKLQTIKIKTNLITSPHWANLCEVLLMVEFTCEQTGVVYMAAKLPSCEKDSVGQIFTDIELRNLKLNRQINYQQVIPKTTSFQIILTLKS